MAAADVLIAWYHGAIPDSVKSSFQRPTKFINLPNPDNWGQTLAGLNYAAPAQSIVDKYAPGTQILRVAVLGFSASCQGIAQFLSSGDGGRLDAVVAVDGLHVGYKDGKKSEGPNPLSMGPWLEFAKKAVANITLFVDTHSSVVPPGYASTTETADYLWNTLTNKSPAGTTPEVPELSIPATSVTTSVNGPTRTVDYPAPPWQPAKRFGGLVILGCDNLDATGTTDHVYQGREVMPLVLTQFLAARWNAMDPANLQSACYMG